MASAIAVQDAIVARLSILENESLNRSQYTDGGVDSGRPSVRAIHWAQYEGSDFEEPSTLGTGSDYQGDRIMNFSVYVRVASFNDNFAIALQRHELVIALLTGYVLPIEGVQEPIRPDNDNLESVRDENGLPVNQYRSRYKVRVLASQIPSVDEDFEASLIRIGFWRSPIDQLANPLTSTKDADLEFNLEEETIGT